MILPLLSVPHYNLSSFINRPVAACWQPVSTTLPLFPENSKLWHEPDYLPFCRSSHLPLLAHVTPSFQLSVPKEISIQDFQRPHLAMTQTGKSHLHFKPDNNLLTGAHSLNSIHWRPQIFLHVQGL